MKDIGLHKIHLFKEQQEIDCSEDSTILKATLAAGINHTHVCGGRAKCSTCRVSIMDGIENCNPRNSAEKLIADKLNFPEKIRLACQAKINGNISIRRMEGAQLTVSIYNT